MRPETHGADGPILVSLFLRGGADGLSLVVPYGDEDYYRNRPTLALARPGGTGANRVLDLDGFFGLHPASAPLLPLYRAGQMAVVHACGLGDQTRSHFEAMATVERGAFRDTGRRVAGSRGTCSPRPGTTRRPCAPSPWGLMVPETLRGATGATALQTVDDLSLQVPWAGQEAGIGATLHDLYGGHDGLQAGGPGGAVGADDALGA
ncbi:MAG: hypothetical protein QM706_20010 [Nitrospira sp.]